MKKLLILAALTFSLIARSQLTVDLGTSKTELGKAALRVGVSYLADLDSMFGNKTHFIPGKHSFFVLTPQLDIQAGTEDAFSTIELKATGLLNVFKTTTVGGLINPDFNKTFHVFPMSLGAETDANFRNTNAIAEIGWIPYWQSYGRPGPEWIKKASFGMYIQGGYKINLDSSGIGGKLLGTEEQNRKGILRARGKLKIDTDKFFDIKGLNLGLVGTAEGWADIINSAFYHKVEGRARVFLNDNNYLDLIFASGSGAPLFNKSEQYGVGITMKL